MPTLSAIQTRLNQTVSEKKSAIVDTIYQQLASQQFQAYFEAKQIQIWCEQYAMTPIQLALEMLPLAACYALVPVSHFYVGAVAIGESGNFYWGANQEFADNAIQQTVHAEQSAISHAWESGELRLTDMVVNYTPCGHCRQFMNEMNSAQTLNIHLPHSQYNLLQNYLPDAFGPKDLGIDKVLFDVNKQTFASEEVDTVIQQAISASERSYAPYSQAYSAVALDLGTEVITGRFAENAAFNPSFLPLQGALNYRRLRGLSDLAVKRIIFAEKKAVLSHRMMIETLAHSLLALPITYIALD